MELERYSTFVAAISETKWFGDNMYEVEDHVILHSGCWLLGKGETLKRGEGVGIVLSHDQVATKAWRESSEEYGYRIITTRLKISGTKHLFIIFSYACFYIDLQSVLDGVPEGDLRFAYSISRLECQS